MSQEVVPQAASTPHEPAPYIDYIDAHLFPLPPTTGKPALIVLSGLPGSGKSYLCRSLASVIPSLVILETDAIRAALFSRPTHAPNENAHVFRTVHRLLERLLADRHTTALDATNLIRRNRHRLYRIAERNDATVIIVETTAPERVIRERLAERTANLEAKHVTEDSSTAGIDVYDRMRRSAQQIRRGHITVDTSQDISPTLNEIATCLGTKEVHRGYTRR